MKNALRPFSKKFATDYFACTKRAAEYQFGRKLVERGEVKIITNAIDIDKFKFDPEARKSLRKEFGIKSDDYVIGNFGRLIPQKNQLFLINAFAEYKKKTPKAKLLIIGDGPLFEKLEKKISKFGLADDVILESFREDINKCYSVLDLFAFPSLYEGLGMVAIEAQIAGVHVIASSNVPPEANVGNFEYRELNNSFLYTTKITASTNMKIDDYSISLKKNELEMFYTRVAC